MNSRIFLLLHSRGWNTIGSGILKLLILLARRLALNVQISTNMVPAHVSLGTQNAWADRLGGIHIREYVHDS
jgi:hypothetical protein